MMTPTELTALLLSDEEMRCVLQAIAELGLPDCWLAAGAVRNAMWNHLSSRPLFDRETDLDVVFFEPKGTQEEVNRLQDQLHTRYPAYRWEVKNQAFMHQHSPHTAPYQSSCDAISKYPERCTAIAVRLLEDDLEIFAPYGLEDIVNFMVRPTPHFIVHPERLALYRQRVSSKNWTDKWPQLQVELENH